MNEIEKLSAVLDRFEGVSDEGVQDTMSICRRRLAKINPEFVLTARAELQSIKRDIIEIAKSAVYIQMDADTLYDEDRAAFNAIRPIAEAAGESMRNELFS